MQIDFGFTDKNIAQYFTPNFVTSEVLTSKEKLYAKGFSHKRLCHFSTGRHCAKKVIENLNVADNEILIGSDNVPVWPKGIVGSISHTNGMVGAVAAKSSELLSIGMDIEEIGRVKGNMWDMLYTPAEQKYLYQLPEKEKALYTTLLFSMKESFYKLQYPLTQNKLWFTDVQISKKDENFSLQVLIDFEGKELLKNSTKLHFAVFNNYVISLCFIES
ncbi:MAG: 4'-phosphopantetheinyl transferase superfamily protein [Bacteroidota bacterium]